MKLLWTIVLISAAICIACDEAVAYELSAPAPITPGYKPALAIDEQGILHLIVMKDGGITYFKKTPDQSWEAAVEAPEIIPDSDTADTLWSRPSIDADAHGNVHVVWTMNDSLYYSRKQYNSAWEAPRVLAYKRGGGWSSVGSNDIMYDPVYQLVHIVYGRAIDDEWSMWHIVSADFGTNWSSEAGLGYDGIKPIIAGAVDGRIHAIWKQKQDNGIGYNVWNPQMNAWERGEEFEQVSDTIVDEVSINTAPDGTPYVIYAPVEHEGSDWYFGANTFTRKINEFWEQPVDVSHITHYYCEDGDAYIPRIVPFSNEEAVSFFYVNWDDTLYYSYWNPQVFEKDSYFGSCNSGFFAVTRNGAETIVIYRNENGVLEERRFTAPQTREWDMSCSIATNSHFYHPGETFQLNVSISSNEPEVKYVDTYIVLDIYYTFYFWPTWTPFQTFLSLPISSSGYQDTLLNFIWPDGSGSLDVAYFHMAILETGTQRLAGGDRGYSYCSFGYSDATPTSIPLPSHTPTPKIPVPPPTPTPYAPQIQLFLNQDSFALLDLFILSGVLVNVSSTDETFLQIYLEIGSQKFYYPAWNEDIFELVLPLSPNMILHSELLVFLVPLLTDDVRGTFHALLYQKVNGLHGRLFCESSVSFVLKAPEKTPTPAATYTPTPAPGNGWISGRAVIQVSGANRAPDPDHEKGVIFSLDGLECETAWVRHRSDYDISLFQVKAVGDTNYEDPCWAEWNYWNMLEAADGEWVCTWGVEDGRTFVSVTAPNGNNETVSVPYIIAFDHITPYNSSCNRPSVPAITSATIISFEPGQRGFTTPCE